MLPKTIEPRRLAQTRQELNGILPLSEMKRLSSLLLDTAGEVSVSLAFSLNCQKQFVVRSQIQTTVTMCCQRCMQPMAVEIDTVNEAIVVRNERAAEQLQGDAEPLLIAEEEIETLDLVEDELILACPIVARHEDDALCQSQLAEYQTKIEAQTDVDTESEQTENPFNVLKDLKSK